MKLTSSDRELLGEHVLRLFELAEAHREFAASRGDRSGCRQTKAGAAAAAASGVLRRAADEALFDERQLKLEGSA